MDKEYLTKITNDLYRLTLLFPKKEPLRYKMRELADNIMTNLVLIIEGDEKSLGLIYEIKKDIEPLDLFFDIAKDQNWVNPENIVEIQEKFNIIREELEEYKNNLEQENYFLETEKELPQARTVAGLASFNSRQKKIVEILKKQEKIQVGDIQKVFPQITKRTIRRDLDSMMKIGTVKREGKANMTFYHLADQEI